MVVMARLIAEFARHYSLSIRHGSVSSSEHLNVVVGTANLENQWRWWSSRLLWCVYI